MLNVDISVIISMIIFTDKDVVLSHYSHHALLGPLPPWQPVAATSRLR